MKVESPTSKVELSHTRPSRSLVISSEQRDPGGRGNVQLSTGWLAGWGLPVHLDLARCAAETGHHDAPIALAEIVEIAGHPDIFLAVLQDLVDFAAAPPLESLQAIGTLGGVQGRDDHAVELGPDGVVPRDLKGFVLLSDQKMVSIQSEFGKTDMTEVSYYHGNTELIGLGWDISPAGFGRRFHDIRKFSE